MEKQKFNNTNCTNKKKLISICDVENYKALECDKVSFDKKGFKYSNGYKDSIG